MDPVRWRSDGVLAAVLLLGMFEVSLFCLFVSGVGGLWLSGKGVVGEGITDKQTEHHGQAAW
jgi:hypothetical protein